MAGIQEQQIFQLAPSGTVIASAFSPADNTTAIIRTIYVAEIAGGTATYQICVDDDGTTYDATTALYWNVVSVASKTVKIETYIAMNNTAGNIAVRSSIGSNLTFTAFGVIIT